MSRVSTLSESARLLARAERLIPAYSQTLSKNPTQWVQGIAPNYVARAQGAHVWDVDGNRWLDFPMALGPIILGHAHPAVNAAIARQLEDGIVFTLPHPLELEVAERIAERVPGAERVRFGKSGSDATSAAIRVARAYTGRERVIACGYHGWHDWYIGSTTRSSGVPAAVRELTSACPFDDLGALRATLEAQRGETAAVILEPSGGREPSPGYLEGVVALAHSHGALAIFDEVVTGFRLAPGGAQERYGVTADLASFGKALGNGMPISAVAGRADVMDKLAEVFFSGTHGGEALSLAAAATVLDLLDAAAYERLYSLGARMRAGVLDAIDEAGVGEWVSITGVDPVTVVSVREPGTDPLRLVAKTVVQQEMLKRGVLWNGANFICLAHTEDDIDHAVDAYHAAFARLADGLPDALEDLLEGEPLSPAFKPQP